MNKIREAINKYSDIKKLIRYSLDIIGIFDGEYAYKGPDSVQIDLTNNCNNNCIGCWCNSPLLGDKTIPPDVKKQTLDYNVVIKLIDKLSVMGTRVLYFSGGGEPLMHPLAIDVLSYAKSKGFICYLHTNFTLVNEDILNRLKGIKLDYLVISLWAGTPQTYAITHPNKNKETFLRMKKLLKWLNETKDSFPKVRLYNVIFNMNYKDFIQMVDFSLETSCECVEFTVIDTIPERTDKLLLDGEQTLALLEICKTARLNKKYYDKDGRFIISNFDQFLRRISSEYSSDAEYDRGFLDSMPCYIGWLFARILADGNVNSCLKSHRMPVGNIYEEEFDVIWNGKKQREFRKAVLRPKKDSPLFSMIGNDPRKEIGCYKSCDDLGRNMWMHEKISKLIPLQRSLLQSVANKKRFKRRLFNNGRYR